MIELAAWVHGRRCRARIAVLPRVGKDLSLSAHFDRTKRLISQHSNSDVSTWDEFLNQHGVIVLQCCSNGGVDCTPVWDAPYADAGPVTPWLDNDIVGP
jgi:hypothetical protein